MGELIVVDGILRFGGFSLPHGFSTTELGNMSFNWGPKDDAERNVEQFYRLTGLSRGNRVHMLPEHGNRIVEVGKENAGSIVQCDVLLTTEKGLTLSLCPADCFPVIITDDANGFVALVHAGWRGTDAKTAKKAVELICGFVRHPYELRVWIGPGINGCCYDEEIDALKKEEWQPFVRRIRRGGDERLAADLLSFNIFQLLESGVPFANIRIAGLCTYCAKDVKGSSLFFSHHRAMHTGEKEGRFVAAVSL